MPIPEIEGQGITRPGSTPSRQSKTGKMGDQQIVRYNPRIIQQAPVKKIATIFQAIISHQLRRSLEAEKYALQHLRQYSEGKIFVLLGNSTAGKSPIIRQLRKEAPEWEESGMDIDFPLQDAETARAEFPELYAKIILATEPVDIGRAIRIGLEPHWKPDISEETLRDAKEALGELKTMMDPASRDANLVRNQTPELYSRMAQAMEHQDIACALFANRVRWKPDITKEVLKDAQEALKAAKKEKYDIKREEEYTRKMDEAVIEQSREGTSVIFDPYDEEAFLARMVEKNNYAPLKIGLAYCPFHILGERVRQRNIKALASGHKEEYRMALDPLEGFCDFYKPAEPGDTVIDTLHREEIESAFEDAFKQQAEFLLEKASEHPPHPPLLPSGDERYSSFMQDHDKTKKEIMTKLGFSEASVTEVNITTSRKTIDYLFNTHVMKPHESSAIIRAWK